MQQESVGEEVSRPRRRRYDAEFKRELVAKTLFPGASVARIARDHGINANQVFKWRRQQLLAEQAKSGGESVVRKPVTLMPVTVLDDAPTASASSDGVIEITLGGAQIRIQGTVDSTTLAQVLSSLRR